MDALALISAVAGNPSLTLPLGAALVAVAGLCAWAIARHERAEQGAAGHELARRHHLAHASRNHR